MSVKTALSNKHSSSSSSSSCSEHQLDSNSSLPSFPASPSAGGRTDLLDIPIKDVIIVMFMLCLWLYSIMLIVRAWAKIHNLPGEYKIKESYVTSRYSTVQCAVEENCPAKHAQHSDHQFFPRSSIPISRTF